MQNCLIILFPWKFLCLSLNKNKIYFSVRDHCWFLVLPHYLSLYFFSVREIAIFFFSYSFPSVFRVFFFSSLPRNYQKQVCSSHFPVWLFFSSREEQPHCLFCVVLITKQFTPNLFVWERRGNEEVVNREFQGTNLIHGKTKSSYLRIKSSFHF